jgi:aspartate/methionine/tyrosine aminotransferase
VAEALLQHGVITVPGDPFGPEAKGFLRVSFCAEESMLTEGVRRIGAALAEMKARQEQPA